MARVGDTRVVARWCYEWLPRPDGELNIDDQKYEVKVCGSFREAVATCKANGLFGEGGVEVERYERDGRYCFWEVIDYHDIYTAERLAEQEG